MTTVTTLSRRVLLKSGGALIVSFAFRGAFAQNNQLPGVDSFLAVHADGSVTIFTSKVDVGTGLSTVFRQTAPEELGIPVARVTVVEGDSATTPNHGVTGDITGVP